MKKIELTQKELDKMLGEQREKGYDMGLLHGKAQGMPYQQQIAVKGIILLNALTGFLDERYEFKKEDY